MNKIILLSLVTVITFTLVGCGGNVKKGGDHANLSCSGKDWEQLGYDTAMSGKNVHDFDKYKEFCGDRLEEVAQDKYLDGYTRAVLKFCTYDNGYEYGNSAKKLPDVCPYEMRANFVKGYNQGVRDREETIQKLEHFSDRQEREKMGGPSPMPGDRD